MPASVQDDPADRSIAGAIARELARRIIEGVIPPGSPLRQDHVAQEFHSSHVPVREAFRRLEAQGLVRAEPRRGVRAAPLDPAAAREVALMRAALESLALREALPHMGPRDIADADRAIREAEASRKVAVWEKANRRFHGAITGPCGMSRLLAAIDNLHRASARYLFAAWRGHDWQPRSEAEHRAILESVRRADVREAQERLVAHITEAALALGR